MNKLSMWAYVVTYAAFTVMAVMVSFRIVGC